MSDLSKLLFRDELPLNGRYIGQVLDVEKRLCSKGKSTSNLVEIEMAGN
jgi:hypothetical protein